MNTGSASISPKPHSSLSDRIARHQRSLEDVKPPQVEGRLRRVIGTTLEAVGCEVPIGGYCLVETLNGDWLEAEVVGFSDDALILMPTSELQGVKPHARVLPHRHSSSVLVGEQLLGRVIDASGKALDGLGPVEGNENRSLQATPINPLKRRPIRQPLDVGVKAINALLTVGQGQRLGLFAGSGVGKSMLLGMMTRYTQADVIVVALIGERGREVKEFIDVILGPEGMKRAVVIATPADHPPLMRMRAAWLATTVAEYFRDQGLQVLLLMDSLTRFAQAQREIALAIGEPPATRGFPPSVFARLPQLVERAGNGEQGGGSVTAFYTVLVEGDDHNDPIADSARAILDGHIVLSRDLAEAGHFPAIDVERSVSRAIQDICEPQHLAAVRRLRQWISRYQQQSDLIRIGAYQPGSDPLLDEAVSHWPDIEAFLQQAVTDGADFNDCLQALYQMTENYPVDV